MTFAIRSVHTTPPKIRPIPKHGSTEITRPSSVDRSHYVDATEEEYLAINPSSISFDGGAYDGIEHISGDRAKQHSFLYPLWVTDSQAAFNYDSEDCGGWEHKFPSCCFYLHGGMIRKIAIKSEVGVTEDGWPVKLSRKPLRATH